MTKAFWGHYYVLPLHCTAIPNMIQLCKRLMSNPSSQSAQDSFVASLRQLLEAIHNIQSVLSHEIDVSNIEEGDSSPVHSPRRPAQERMLKSNIGRQRNQRYIGRLQTAADQSGDNSRPTCRTMDIQVGGVLYSHGYTAVH